MASRSSQSSTARLRDFTALATTTPRIARRGRPRFGRRRSPRRGLRWPTSYPSQAINSSRPENMPSHDSRTNPLIPEPIRPALEILRADYAKCAGTPFKHFYCPMLLADEEVELCMGHIVSQRKPISCKKWVVQRKDVDGFFGQLETDFLTLMRARGGLPAVLCDPKLAGQLPIKITSDGQEVDHYRMGKQKPDYHTGLILDVGTGSPVK